MGELQQKFDAFRKETCYRDSMDPMRYIRENSSIIGLPDRSRSAGDQITLTAVRTSRDGKYDIFSRSFPEGKQIAASFPLPESLETEAHSHNYVELSFVPEGTMRIRFQDQTETFEAGDICLIRRGLLHADVLSCDDTIMLYLGLSDSFFRNSFLLDVGLKSSAFLQEVIIKKRMKHDFVRFSPKTSASEVPDLYRLLLEEALTLRPGYLHLIQGYCERILCSLPSEYRIALTDVEQHEYMYHVYQDVIAYIEEHYATVSAGELSRIFGYNPDYFNRLIRRYSDKTYTGLLQETRLKAAAALLESTDLPADEIAGLVGYTNLGYFYRHFRLFFQKTPGQYRKAAVSAKAVKS